MEKLYTSKVFLKMASGRMHTPHPTPLNPPLAISYRKNQKSLAYFSHLAPSILFFFAKRHNQKGGGHNTMVLSPKYAPASANVLFFTDIQRRAVEKEKNRLWRDSRKKCMFS